MNSQNYEYPDYEGMKSVCCSADVIEGTFDICESCQEHTGFEPDEEDEYSYPTTAEIEEMRSEYLKEKDTQEAKQWKDDRRETLLEQADLLKKQQKENL